MGPAEKTLTALELSRRVLAHVYPLNGGPAWFKRTLTALIDHAGVLQRLTAAEKHNAARICSCFLWWLAGNLGNELRSLQISRRIKAQHICFRLRRLAIIRLLFHCPLIFSLWSFFSLSFPPCDSALLGLLCFAKTRSGVLHPTKSPFLLKRAFFEQHFDTLIYLRSSSCGCISPPCNSRISFHNVFRLWAFHLDLLNGRGEGDYFLSPCARIRVAVDWLAFDRDPPPTRYSLHPFQQQGKI